MDKEISDAWRVAGMRLGVRVVAPHRVDLPDGTVVEMEAFLPDFGGIRGAGLVAADDQERCQRASASGLYVSRLGAPFRRFDEALFRESLDDWGWFGPAAARPGWYTGKPWA